MSALETLTARARARRARVLLVSGGEPVRAAVAAKLASDGFGAVTVIGEGGVRPGEDDRLSAVAAKLRDRWPERVRDGIHALDLAAEPILFAAGLVLSGEAEICIAGASLPTPAVEDAFRWILGPTRATAGRGSIRYVLTSDDRLLTTVTPDTAGPLDARGLAGLALAAANHRGRALGDHPRVAFLVPPPSQDASHADAELALAEFRALAPGISAGVEWSWGDGSGPTAGGGDGAATGRFRSRPNVLIFPGPVSGHLAHALLRDAGAVRVWGPLFPHDRWAVAGPAEGSDDDIVAVATVAAAGLAGA
jgi:phosphotransacetylase